jgi:putative chitinase
MEKVDITAADLKRLVELKRGRDSMALPRAALYAEALEGVRDNAKLDSALRVRHFMAQLAHETGGFRGLVESLDYRDPERLAQMFSNVQSVEHARRLIEAGPVAIGSCIYAFKLGNGSPATGDGYRFRGRGFIMNTGRANYNSVQKYAGFDPALEHDPDSLGQPVAAAEAAAAFWEDRRLNAAADANEIDQITRVVNGPAMAGRQERRAWLAEAEKIWF